MCSGGSNVMCVLVLCHVNVEPSSGPLEGQIPTYVGPAPLLHRWMVPRVTVLSIDPHFFCDGLVEVGYLVLEF